MNTKFNPIKEEKDGKVNRIVWTSESLNLSIEALRQGKRLVANPFYDNNVRLLKGDLIYQRTDEEKKEWLKCRDDINYFAEKYCKLMTPLGIKHVKLRDYQEKYLQHVQDNQLSIALLPRQSGKTTTTALAMLHFLLFNIDKNALICSNKRKSAVEVVDKVKKIYVEIPHFLKPGIYKWNEAEIVMDNGCRVQAEATTINSGIGLTISWLLLDEFAHVSPGIVEKFYNNIFPTVTAAKAKVTIISTQNGRNLFYRLYTAAKQHENDYRAFEINWWDIPEWNPEKKCWEKRDEEWHRRQVANYGSEEAFNSQFGINFDIGANTLISQKKFKVLNVQRFINKDIFGVPHPDQWFWHPDFDPMTDLRKSFIIGTCDLAEGLNQDYTVFQLYRMVNPGTDDLECVGYFRANHLIREMCAESLMSLYIRWCHPDRALLSFERNTYGEIFLKDINELAEKKPELAAWDPNFFVKYYTESGTKFHYGIKITSGNKTTHCIIFKESFERDKIINEAEQFVYELQNFCDDGTGHYKASFGHDDMVMSAVQLEFVKKELQYKMMRDDFESGNAQQDDTIWNPYEEFSAWPGMQIPSMTDYDINSLNRLQNF